MKYLGHGISCKGVPIDPGKIEAVANWQRLTHVSEIHSFLGFASYYQCFVECFAKLAAPLHKMVAELTGTTRNWFGWTFSATWMSHCEKSFEYLKAKPITAPLLAYVNFSLPFILEANASHSGFGAVLSQAQDD